MSPSPRRRVSACLGVAAALAATPVLAALAAGDDEISRRIHRLILPPPEGATSPTAVPTPVPGPGSGLPRRLAVDEVDLPGGAFGLRPSRLLVGAGEIEIAVNNRSMDAHDLAVFSGLTRPVLPADRPLARIDLEMKTTKTLTLNLAAGRYRVVCSYFAGTPSSHDAGGMNFFLDVQ